jgi:ADP-heptose:LPS heptosyltransferase
VQFLSMVEALDVDPRDVPLLKAPVELGHYRLPVFRPARSDQEEVEGMLARCGGYEPESPLVVLNCNLIDQLPLRQWSRANFVELAQRILNEHPDATLVLTGLRAERVASRALADELDSPRVISVAGETTLRSLVTLFSMADLLITSDCGTGHMAALTNVPIVSLYGPETPMLYAPLTPNNRSLWAGLACSPCLNAMNHRRSCCRDNVCMREITVDEVYRAAIEQCAALSECAVS